MTQPRPGTAAAVGIVIEVTGQEATKIVALEESTGNWSTADTYCTGYTDASGTSSWYLPSKDELNLVYQAKTAVNAAIGKVGGSAVLLTDEFYWSSSQYKGNMRYWTQHFGDGSQNYGDLYGIEEFAVRAIRAFSQSAP